MNRYRRLPLQNCTTAGTWGLSHPGRQVHQIRHFSPVRGPCELPREDLEFLLDYGVTGTADLRSQGSGWPGPTNRRGAVRLPPGDPDHRAAAGGGDSQRQEDFDWGRQYRRMAEDNPAFFREILPLCLKEPGALLFHCTTGKDRTGLLSCVLLSIAGVSKEDIAADYCVSQLYLGPVYEKMKTAR